MNTPDYIDLNVPGLLRHYKNPAQDHREIVLSYVQTQLYLFKRYELIKESAAALHGPIDQAVVRFSDYTPQGQIFVKSGALDKWLSSCDRKNSLAAYKDPVPLEKRIKKFLADRNK